MRHFISARTLTVTSVAAILLIFAMLYLPSVMAAAAQDPPGETSQKEGGMAGAPGGVVDPARGDGGTPGAPL